MEENVDKIFYINLSHRTDRNDKMIEGFKKMNLLQKAERFDAIKHKNGAVGCALSHIACLEMAKERKLKNVLILEDDIEWRITREELDQKLLNFFDNIDDWAVLLFSVIADHMIYVKEGICRVKKAYTTAGYFLDEDYYDELIKCFKGGIETMEKGGEEWIDVAWWPLQEKHKYYMIVPVLAHQYDNASDIRGEQIIQYRFDKPFSVRMEGGSGNRMFQLAFGYAKARKYGEYFFLQNEKFPNPHSKKKHFEDLFPHSNRHIDCQVEEKPEDYSSAVFIDYCYPSFRIPEICGFFQNEKYFSLYKDDIIKMFTPKLDQEIEESLRKRYPLLDQSYFIHVRRGDMLQSSKHCIDLSAYYKRCMKSLKKDNFYIFSDDLEYCKQNFKKGTIVEEQDELISLWLMSKCWKGGICANSSFSWWGSYLNTNPEKQVFMPSKWLNVDWKCDIYPSFAKIVSVHKESYETVYLFNNVKFSEHGTKVENEEQVIADMKEKEFSRALIVRENLKWKETWKTELDEVSRKLKSFGTLILHGRGKFNEYHGIRKEKNIEIGGAYIIDISGKKEDVFFTYPYLAN
jgi:hypothetical protein